MSQAHPRNRSEWLEPPDDHYVEPPHEGHYKCHHCGETFFEANDQLCCVECSGVLEFDVCDCEPEAYEEDGDYE